jgi:hypothetical protein
MRTDPAALTKADLRRQWRRGLGHRIVEMMAVERTDMIARWQAQNAFLRDGYDCALTKHIHWTGDRRFGARLKSMPVSGGEIDGAIEIDQGTQCAIDDLACHALASKSFLMDYQRTERRKQQILVLLKASPERYRAYPDAKRAAEDPSMLISALPLNRSKMRAASALSELCLDWVQLHEQSHFILGHLDLLMRCMKTNVAASLDETSLRRTRKEGLGQRTRKILEYQADSYALELLFVNHLRPGLAAVWKNDGYSELGFETSAFHRKPDLGAFRRIARVLLVAAGLVALLLENGAEGGSDHPTAGARLFSLILCAANLTDEFLSAHMTIMEQPQASERRRREMLVRLIYEASLDLALVASTLGVRDEALHYDPRIRSPFMEDLFLMWGSGDTARGSALTRAAQQFVRLQPHSARISAILARIHRGGEYLEGRM